jgi:hypothetical protein
MTFKWSYLITALIAIAVVVVTWAAQGTAEAFSHFYAIAIFVITGLVMVVAFRGVRAVRPRQASDEPFVSYPKNFVLGIFDRSTDASEALTEFRDSGRSGDEIMVFSGGAGLTQLDPDHGLTGVTERSIERLMTDQDNLDRYAESVRRGGHVIAIAAKETAAREEAAAIFMRHDAHDVEYFGEFTVETLDEPRSRLAS